MKTQKFNGLKMSLRDTNPSSNRPDEILKNSSQNTGDSRHLVSPVSCATNKTAHLVFGSKQKQLISGSEIDPENDFTGLDAEWLYKEGSRYYYITMMVCILAVHLSYATYWTASKGMYVHAVLVAALATIFWGKVIKNFRLAGRFIAAADESLESEKSSN